MGDHNSNINKTTSPDDFKINILSYNVLYSNVLDKNGPEEMILKEIKNDGKIEVNLIHGMSTHHGEDFKKDFPDGKYSKTIPLDIFNNVKRAVEEDLSLIHI